MPGRAIAAFLCVVLVGPLLGYCGLITYIFLHEPPRSDDFRKIIEFLPMVYYIGGGPAIIAGLIIAWLIGWRSWIGLRAWLTYSAVFALVPPVAAIVVFLALDGWKSTTEIMLDRFTPMWITTILFASVGLRVLLIAGQVLPPPGRAGDAYPFTDEKAGE